jgi:hypothetical protein
VEAEDSDEVEARRCSDDEDRAELSDDLVRARGEESAAGDPTAANAAAEAAAVAAAPAAKKLLKKLPPPDC